MDKDKVLAWLDRIDIIDSEIQDPVDCIESWDAVMDVCKAIRYEVESSPWIKVGDRLPEDMEFVIVFCGDGISVSGYSRKHSIWNIELPMECDSTVTHWMPLPETPERENA